MDCSRIEQLLSEYLESSLPAEEAEHLTTHLKSCTSCSALLNEMRKIVSLCESYPVLELDPEFTERILLRTSGRPRTRTFKERLEQYFVRPLFTPRFAVGASLATLFVVFMVPRFSGVVSSLSPQAMLRLLDRGVSQLYGEGLKAYEAKNEWQEQFNRIKNNTWNGLRSVMEQMDGPVEGRKKQNDGEPRKDNAPKEKSSGVLASTSSPA